MSNFLSLIIRRTHIASFAFALVLGSCATAPRTPYDAVQASRAVPTGFEGERIRADSLSDTAFASSLKVDLAAQGHFSYLALSGGGGDGAYGAGILNGWTRSGSRPLFSLVSGVSTGALIAPFAFLGPDYDTTLEAIYTNGEAANLVAAPNLLNALFGNGLFGSRQLLDLVSRYVNQDLVDRIAVEHRRGRQLLILTTNLDRRRGTVWNIGAIAASDRPERLDLIRKVLAASASVPLLFAPPLISATADGKTFDEMHVDGGVTSNVFILPRLFLAAGRTRSLKGGNIYIIMNTSTEPRFSIVENKTIDITSAAFETTITQKTIDTLVSTYAFAKDSGIGFNLTSVDPALEVDPANSFNTEHMTTLYHAGVSEASEGGFWRHVPPAIDPVAAAIAAR